MLTKRIYSVAWRNTLLAVLLATWPVMAQGQVFVTDNDPYPDAKTQDSVRSALDALQKNPLDLSAMEILVAAEPGGAQHLGTNFFIIHGDPLRKEALARVTSFQPAELLTAAISKGSDPAAAWAFRLVSWQSDNNKIDEKARIEIQAAMTEALKTRSDEFKVAAMPMIAKWTPKRLPDFFHDKDENVVAAAIQQFANRHSDSPEARAVVSAALLKTTNPAMNSACCTYWWLVRGDDLAPVTDDEQAILEKWGSDDSAEIRQGVIRAVSHFATPKYPRMLALLKKLTQDKNELVRDSAKRTLDNATGRK